MLRRFLAFVFLAVFLLPSALAQTSPIERQVVTDKGETRDTPVAHPLSWWTQDSLRLDMDRTLPLGLKATDGHLITAQAHPVDFSQLDRAIKAALPPDTGYTSRCWALHPEESRLRSGVQVGNATCHACGWVGDVVATYRIWQGAPFQCRFTFSPTRSSKTK